MILSGFSHQHVTEREGAHTHPNGAFDDASWEDCTFMAAIEWWRASGHPEVPATHAEGEAMRDASGISTTGGSTIADVRRGITAQYGSPTPPPIAGSARVWAAMVPGSVGLIQGSMAAFPNGSSWRRWDPAFNGAHAICAFRPDATDRVWWCDPLAPENGYSGEWMPRAEFTAYIDGLGGYSLVSQVVPDKTTGGDPMLIRKAEGWKTIAGATRYDAPDGTVLGTWPAGVEVTSIGETMDGLWRLVAVSGTGAADPRWIYIRRSDLVPLVQGGDRAFDAAVQSLLLSRAAPAPPLPDTSPYTQADIDAAVSAALLTQSGDLEKLQTVIANIRAALPA